MGGRVIALLCLSALAWHASAGDATACSCSPTTPCQAWGRSTAAFVGDIVDVQPSGGGTTTRLRVVRAFKGVTESAVVSVRGSDGTCSLGWSVGERWVVYAVGGPSDLRSNLCSGSRRLNADAPAPDLRPEPGVVDGWLFRRNAPSGVQPWIEGAPVWIETPAGRIESRTAAQGSFRLSGVPPGTWTVRFALGADESASSEAVIGPPDRCTTVTALAEPAPPRPAQR